MSKQLYEEALADAKKLKEVAEDNAKKSLIEAVTPRIRDLIEKELLREFNEADFDEMDCDDDFGPPGAPMPDGKLMTDIGGVKSPVSSPGPDGKVTLDLDALARNMGGPPVAAPMFGGAQSPDEEYMLEPEDALKLDSLSPVLDGGAKYPQDPMTTRYPSEKTFVSDLNKFENKVAKLVGAKATIKESKVFISEINSMVTKLDNMYAYVQESIRDSGRKKLYETRLELYFAKLRTLQEKTMRNRRSLNETELVIDFGEPEEDQSAKDWLASLGTDGLSAELDMGGGDEDEEGEDDMDLDMGDEDEDADEEGEEGEDLDFGDEGEEEEDDEEGGDLDFGDEDEEEGDEEGGDEMQLSWHNRGKVMESRRNKDNLVVEIDEGMLRREIGRMREARQLREAKALRARRLAEARRRRLYEFDAPSADGHGALVDDDFGGDPEEKIEPLKVKLQEYDILEISEYGQNEEDEGEDLKDSYDPAVKAESRRFMSRNGGGRNGTPSGRTGIAETKLRRQLEETNLFNAKLIYSNKLLQNESLSRRQKAEIIERLDEAKTLREVKLVYESLTKAMAGTSRPLRENATRKVLGSSSMTTRPASTQLNEGFETERWARLAGITK